jgi:large subunit ribosomal protein L4
MDAPVLKTINGSEEINLDPTIFLARKGLSAVHEVVRWQRACARAGTRSVLTRSFVNKTTKKPWKQKGTGRARAGSASSPLWVGGAVAHGPSPKSFAFKIPKKVKKQAVKSVLSDRFASGSIFLATSLNGRTGKTKELCEWLKNTPVGDSKVLILCSTKMLNSDSGKLLYRAANNLPNVTVMPAVAINPYSVLNVKYLMFDKESLAELEHSLV